MECLLEKSRARLLEDQSRVKKVHYDTLTVEDDMRKRSIRDANRGFQRSGGGHGLSDHNNSFLASKTDKSHYVWKTPIASVDKYKSQFFPMRQHDLVRDDLAVRRLNNNVITGAAKTKSLEAPPRPVSRKPPPHPNPSRKRPRSLPPPSRRAAGSHQSLQPL